MQDMWEDFLLFRRDVYNLTKIGTILQIICIFPLVPIVILFKKAIFTFFQN